MSGSRFAASVLALLAAGGFVACSEDAPVAPAAMDHMSMDVAGVTLEPFTFRAPVDPYKIHQLPDFMIHSQATSDIVYQRLVFAPGAGMWHTHPGPSFVYVIQGQIKLDRFNSKDGCTETPVSGPGNVYSEVANEVHRAVVVSDEPVVVLVTRFNIPVGGPITIPAADPGC
jgi:quercetin dioxygenase-like cupin family protein